MSISLSIVRKIIIIFVILLFSVNTFAQMLPLEKRYEIIGKNLQKEDNKKLIKNSLIKILNNKYILEKVKSTLNNYYNTDLQKKLTIIFAKILYAEENKKYIQNAFNDLLKDESFKLEILKIIKSQTDKQKLFLFLSEYFNKKFKKNLNPILKNYLKQKFLCKHNVSKVFNVFVENLLSRDSYKQIKNHYKKNLINKKYIDKFKQKLASLPYEYKLDNWFYFYLKSSLPKLEKELKNKEINKEFVNSNIEKIVINMINELLQNDDFIKQYSKEFQKEFLADDKKLKNIIKSILLDDLVTINKKLENQKFNCFYLNSKMIKIDSGFLSLYIQDLLQKDLSNEILLILFKNL